MPGETLTQLNAQSRAEQIVALINRYSQLSEPINASYVHNKIYLTQTELDKVLGCVKVRKLSWFLLEVSHLVVDLKNRRKGLARGLVAQAEEWGKSNGAKIAHCTIRLQNTPSIRLFYSSGYQPGPIFQGPREMVRLWTKALL